MSFSIPEMTALEWVQVIAFINLAICQTIFIYLWGRQIGFSKGYVGKAFYFKSFSLALMADIAVAGVFFDWPYEEVIKTVVYWMVSLGSTIQLVAWLFRHKQVQQEIAIASYRDDYHVK